MNLGSLIAYLVKQEKKREFVENNHSKIGSERTKHTPINHLTGASLSLTTNSGDQRKTGENYETY